MGGGPVLAIRCILVLLRPLPDLLRSAPAPATGGCGRPPRVLAPWIWWDGLDPEELLVRAAATSKSTPLGANPLLGGSGEDPPLPTPSPEHGRNPLVPCFGRRWRRGVVFLLEGVGRDLLGGGGIVVACSYLWQHVGPRCSVLPLWPAPWLRLRLTALARRDVFLLPTTVPWWLVCCCLRACFCCVSL